MWNRGRAYRPTSRAEIRQLVNVQYHRRRRFLQYKGKGNGLDTYYSATYMSQTPDQQRFTISEVAADWHEQVVPQRISLCTLCI